MGQGQRHRGSSVELQLGQEIIVKLRQGVEIKACNIDCICGSETLGAVCVMAGFENQWISLSSSSWEWERTDDGSGLSLCH